MLEPITRSVQLLHTPVTAFSQTDLFLVWIYQNTKNSRCRSRSPKYAEFGHFTLLLSRERQRNQQRFLTFVRSHWSTHWTFCLVAFSSPLPSWFAFALYWQREQKRLDGGLLDRTSKWRKRSSYKAFVRYFRQRSILFPHRRIQANLTICQMQLKALLLKILSG